MAPGELTRDLQAIDWTRPWFEPWAALGRPAAMAVSSGQGVYRALDASGRGMVSFVPADDLPRGMAYESHIDRNGLVPTRDCAHDFFNGLVWLRFPRTKKRLNELHAMELGSRGVGGRRGALRDALTLLDENGALLFAPAALREALMARQWHALFVHGRALWAQARLVIFGHALLEKLIAPRKDITAHVCVWPDMPAFDNDEQLDHALARWADPALLVTKPFCPLPVLGVPGWCEDNEHERFYDDPRVFRTRSAQGHR